MKKKSQQNTFVIIECEFCRINIDSSRNVFQYTTTKNKQTFLTKISLRKYCKFCKAHQNFNETK